MNYFHHLFIKILLKLFSLNYRRMDVIFLVKLGRPQLACECFKSLENCQDKSRLLYDQIDKYTIRNFPQYEIQNVNNDKRDHRPNSQFYFYVCLIVKLIRWSGGVLWHINYYGFLKAKSCLLYMICRRIVFSVKLFLNEPELICFHTFKSFQVFLSKTNKSIYVMPHI